jgi:uncharacterized protein DUF955
MNRGYRVPPKSRQVLRDAAADFRNALGLSDKPWLPIVDIYEFLLPRLWEEFHFEVLAKDEMGREHAIAYPAEARIAIREDIYARACEDEGRDRFTLSHELGHIVLQHTRSFAESTGPNSWKVYEDSEWQANAFAAELLMPVQYVVNSRTASELVDRCGVSLQAAITQRHLVTKENTTVPALRSITR